MESNSLYQLPLVHSQSPLCNHIFIYLLYTLFEIDLGYVDFACRSALAPSHPLRTMGHRPYHATILCSQALLCHVGFSMGCVLLQSMRLKWSIKTIKLDCSFTNSHYSNKVEKYFPLSTSMKSRTLNLIAYGGTNLLLC